MLAAAFVAEIGDVSRFPSPELPLFLARARSSPAGSTGAPGWITKPVEMVRWAAVEAVTALQCGDQGQAP